MVLLIQLNIEKKNLIGKFLTHKHKSSSYIQHYHCYYYLATLLLLRDVTATAIAS